MQTDIEYATVKREAEVYAFVRKHVERIVHRRYVEKELNYDINILANAKLIEPNKLIISKYIVVTSSLQNKVAITDLLLLSVGHFLQIPDQTALPFHRVTFVDSVVGLYLLNKEIIPFYMLEEYGGFIPEIPKLFQHH